VIGNSIAFRTTQADVTDDIRGDGALYLKAFASAVDLLHGMLVSRHRYFAKDDFLSRRNLRTTRINFYFNNR
jgi:hypothetical protein